MNPKLDEQCHMGAASGGTSIFDPVLCELVYRWFCTPGGIVIDPFAGGSVRGIVASHLGLQYIGIDLRPEQIEANREQAARIAKDPQPVWIVGDSRNIGTLCTDVKADLIFSCPPYADLERYSDDPLDLSTMDYPVFIEAYRAIIAASCSTLKPNRFACFVVGDIRDREGFYRGFVSDTRQAFEDCGLHLYNEAVLVTAVGSLPIRVGKQFSGGRKLGKTHQNVLVFYNGDPKAIKQEFPADVQVGEISEEAVLSAGHAV
jgi:DNA modification methylase